MIAPELSISHYCFKIFVGISDEWDALFESNFFISFSTPVRDTVLKEKLKLHFLRIVLILEWFWYLDTAGKTSSLFSGVWPSKLFGTLRSKLESKF